MYSYCPTYPFDHDSDTYKYKIAVLGTTINSRQVSDTTHRNDLSFSRQLTNVIYWGQLFKLK